MKFIINVFTIWIAITFTARADSPTPKVSPLTDIYIPLGANKVWAPAIPTATYPLIKVTPKSYLILFQRGTNITVGLIPKTDQRRSPTAIAYNGELVIRSGVSTTISQGYIPYDAGKRYDVVGETETSYSTRFLFGNYSTVCSLSKTSVVYISAAEIQQELEAAEQINLASATKGGNGSVNQEAGPSITTVNGRIYQNAKVTLVEPDGITVKHTGGVAKLLFSELPREIQEEYDYDPAKAEKYAYDKYLAQQNAHNQKNNGSDDEWGFGGDYSPPASSGNTTFQGAVITEQGVNFAVVIVKPHVVDSPSLAKDVINAFSPIFGYIPVVLMAQDFTGRATYYGRSDIVDFLAGISSSSIPWKEFTLSQ